MEQFAILLVRVSTFQQDYQPQISDLKQFAKGKGYNHFHIIETKESGLGDLNEKIGANELLNIIKQNEQYKTVFMTELSRLGRTESVLHQIKDWFIDNKIQLYLKDTDYTLFDSKGKVSSAGSIMFTLYGFFAESEVKQKKERFIRARRKLMEEGKSISGKTLFGYLRKKEVGEKSYFILYVKPI